MRYLLPTLIKCPTCGSRMEKQMVASGNLHRAVHFTDGKVEAPMLPDFPLISKCPPCQNYFWVEDAKEVESDSQIPQQALAWQPHPIRALTIGEYHEALEKGLSRNREEELYLRIQLWRQFNDRVREAKPLVKSAVEEKVWRDNLTSLIHFLDSSDPGQSILKAEALRSLGFFQQAIKEVDNVKDAEYQLTGETIRRACDQELTVVLKIVPAPKPLPSPKEWNYWAKVKVKWFKFMKS